MTEDSLLSVDEDRQVKVLQAAYTAGQKDEYFKDLKRPEKLRRLNLVNSSFAVTCAIAGSRLLLVINILLYGKTRWQKETTGYLAVKTKCSGTSSVRSNSC